MGKITTADVRSIADLSRIELGEDEVAEFARQIESILAWVGQLEEVDIAGIEPFLNAAEEGNVLRDDEAAPSLARELGLANSPQQAAGCFRVPGVLG